MWLASALPAPRATGIERKQADGVFFRHWRRPHARGINFPYANGEDKRCYRTAEVCRYSLYFGDDRSRLWACVSASLALLGDINIAEPDVRAGFAGPNIIEQTIRQQLPEGFQRSEFLLDHGAIDMIVHRKNMRETLSRLLKKLVDRGARAGDGADVVDAVK